MILLRPRSIRKHTKFPDMVGMERKVQNQFKSIPYPSVYRAVTKHRIITVSVWPGQEKELIGAPT